MLLYLIRFEKMFKVGITSDYNRIYRLISKVYKNFVPKLHESYILHYNKVGIIRGIETLIKDTFIEFTYDFQGEIFDGYTECFKDECFNEVLKIIEFHVEINIKNKNDIKMNLVKGITRKELKVSGNKKDKIINQPKTFSKISGDLFFIDFLQRNKDNVSVDIKEINNIYYLKVHFQEFEFLNGNRFPVVDFFYRDGNCHGSAKLIHDFEYKQFEFAYFITGIIGSPHTSCLLKFPEVFSFYKEVFRILNLDIIWEKIENNYLIEQKTLLLN